MKVVLFRSVPCALLLSTSNQKWDGNLTYWSFFSSFKLFRKSHSLRNKVWGTSELLLGSLLLYEKIKPLCLLDTFHPILDLILSSHTQVLYHQLTSAEFLPIYFSLAKREWYCVAGRCKLQYLVPWTCNWWNCIFYKGSEMHVYIKSFIYDVLILSCQCQLSAR